MSDTMIPQQMPEAMQIPAFFAKHLGGPLRPAVLLLAVMVALAKNQCWPAHCTWLPRKLAQVIRLMRDRLDRDPLLDEYSARCLNVSKSDLVTRILVSFWAPVLDVTVKDLCAHLMDPTHPLFSLRAAFGLKQPCHPQRISELHQAIGGAEGKAQLHQRLQGRLVSWLQLNRLTEADVAWASESQTFDRPLWRAGKGYGFDAFFNFLFWQGTLGYLELALSSPLAANGYKLRDLIMAYCHRLHEAVHTGDDLEAYLRNHRWADQATSPVVPVSHTVSNLLLKFDLECVLVLQQDLTRRAHRGHHFFTIAVDACLIELFGDYEGADQHWDHVTNQTIRGYKLYVAFSVHSGQPVAFYLHQEGDKDADVLDALLCQTRTILGVKRLGLILFDKGFWRTDEFKKIVGQREGLITPAKRYATVRDAIAAIPSSCWRRSHCPNERWAETTVFFGVQSLHLRLVVRKRLGWRKKRDDQGQVVKDEQGKPILEPIILYHSYLTNLSPSELDTDQVLASYALRWGVEDFFEQMLNQYDLDKFPGISLRLVNLHIVLTFVLYILVQLFQQLAADWLNDVTYATMELRRFGKEFLWAPLTLLRWLLQRRPRQQAPLNHRSNAVALAGALALGYDP